MQPIFSLKNKRALVTGGGTGLGKGIALALTEAGCRVLITGRRIEQLQQTQADIGAEKCEILQADILQSQDRDRVIHAAPDLLGGCIDILINNAGNHLKKPAKDTSDSEFELVMQTHINASFALARAVYPQMKKNGGGSIIMLASMASYMGLPNIVAYTTAKTAVVGVTRALSSEWAQDGIRINAIAPGWIESPMLRQALDQDAARKQRILDRTPMHRFGQPSDIGNAAVFLCSPAASFVTGVVLPVDGGASVGF
jgi:gluconate 5-dehydrogenase